MSKKQKLADKINAISDEYGNNLYVHNNGVRILIFLKLKQEARKRRLGVINLDTKTFYVKRVRAKHLFNKNQSYGFNYKLLSEAKKFDKVRLQDDFNEWLIPVKYILDNGSFLHFKGEGFERQIFIELSSINEFERGLKI